MRKTECRKCGAEYYKSGGGPINDCPKCAEPEPCPRCSRLTVEGLAKVIEDAENKWWAELLGKYETGDPRPLRELQAQAVLDYLEGK